MLAYCNSLFSLSNRLKTSYVCSVVSDILTVIVSFPVYFIACVVFWNFALSYCSENLFIVRLYTELYVIRTDNHVLAMNVEASG